MVLQRLVRSFIRRFNRAAPSFPFNYGPWFPYTPAAPNTPFTSHPMPAFQDRTPPRHSARDVLFSSPLVEHESFIGGDGLLTFCKWCDKEYKIRPEPFIDSPFDEAYRVLQRNRITVDIMGRKDAEWYKKEGVASGTAERMAKSFAKWRSQLNK